MSNRSPKLIEHEKRLSLVLEATKGLGFWGRLELLTDALAVIVRAADVKGSSKDGNYVRCKLRTMFAQAMRTMESRFPDVPEETEDRPKLLN